MSSRAIHREPDAERAGRRAAALFATIARESIAARGRFTVALAGGSSPALMHEALARWSETPAIEWAKIDFFFGDERAVPSDTKQSNFYNARHSLLDRVPLEWARVHAMEAWRDDRESAAQQYEQTLRAIDGALDLLVLGVGEDSHILSLYPGCPLIHEDGGSLVAALRDPPMNPAVDRLTLTPSCLFAARTVLVLMVGAKKRAAWRAFDAREGAAMTHPVRLLREVTATLHVVGDHEAIA